MGSESRQRRHVVGTRLDDDLKAYLETVRGALTPGQYLRKLLVEDRRRRREAKNRP